MKKLVNLIALIMLVSTNVFTPFSYAEVDVPEVIPENEVGNVEEIGETREKDNEITGEIQNSLGEVEGEGSLPLVREVVNESEPEGLKEEVEDSLDAVESPTIDEDKKEDPEKSESDEVAQQEEENTKIEKQEENLEDNNEITEQENVEAEIQELQKTQEISTMDTATNSKNIVLQATATEAGQTLKINKYFENAYTVDWGDGNTGDLTADTGHTYDIASGYTITLSLSGADRWTFQYVNKPLVPTNGTTVTGVKITYMPSLADGFGYNATAPGEDFFNSFNSGGALTSLPTGSFDTSNITTAGSLFFGYFNINGQLTSLPTGSFDISNIITVGNIFFHSFNYNGALTSLPTGSFRLATGLTTVGNNFFSSFNYNGALTSLPTGSLDTSNITTAGSLFFSSFNHNGALTSLPTGSFDTSNITTAGDYFFQYFNYNGALTSLPTGSFDISNITTVGDYFFEYFNYNGQLTSLPDSFKLTSAAYNKTPYNNAFNSSNYTLNKRVSDLVSEVTVPSTDRNTFSDNQPGRCGVHANWLVSTANACSITYDSNGGSTITNPTKRYTANTESVVAGNGISIPTKEGYFVEGWYDVSGNNVDEVIFPDMDGWILYAHWGECSDGYVVNSNGTGCVLKEYTITYNLGGGYLEDGEGNIYEGNQVVTYTYNTDTNEYDPNLNPESIKKENSQFLGWYTSEGDAFDFGIVPPDNSTAYAKFACNLGCVENTEKTACEKIRVDFDANGGTFSDNDNIYTVIKSKQIFGEKTGALHTANLDDNDNYTNEFNGQTINGYTTYLITYTSGGITTYPISSPSIVYFEEENVEKLDVSIKYGGSPYCTPGYIIVWTGDHRQFDANYNPGNTGLAVLYIADFPNFGENREKSVEIEGDSFTIYQNGGCSSYGFFANISRTQIVDLIYEDNAFENIPEPTREGHSFKGWYLSDGSEFDTGNVSTGEVTYVYAKWECADGYENKGGECIKKSSGSSGGGGGGGRGGGSSKKTDEDIHGSAEDSQKNTQDDKNTENVIQSETKGSEESINTPIDSSADKSASEGQEMLSPSDSPSSAGQVSFTKEQKDAYQFAKENGITTKDTIQSAQMDGKLTRIAMAKMLSQYAINVLGQTPDTSKTIKFRDVTSKKDADYDNGVTLAYQLGIMGQNMPNNKFRPNDEVSRAEFVTALSRLLYQTTDGEYKSTSKYYTPHMAKLYNEGIINNTDPGMKERRGYVMIMLMRSAK